MDIGMLWFDDSSRTFAEKVRRAVDYYTEKYGREPTLCLVNPDTWENAESKKMPVEMRQARLVLPNHFWIGVDEEAKPVRHQEKKPARAAASAPSMPAGKAA